MRFVHILLNLLHLTVRNVIQVEWEGKILSNTCHYVFWFFLELKKCVWGQKLRCSKRFVLHESKHTYLGKLGIYLISHLMRFDKIWTLVCNLFVRRGIFIFLFMRGGCIRSNIQGKLHPFRWILGMQPLKMPSLLPNIFIHPFWWMKEDFLASNKTPSVYPAHSITFWLCTWFAASNLQPFLGEVSATHLGLHVVLLAYAATWKAYFGSPQRRQCSKNWVEFQICRSLLCCPSLNFFFGGEGFCHYTIIRWL